MSLLIRQWCTDAPGADQNGAGRPLPGGAGEGLGDQEPVPGAGGRPQGGGVEVAALRDDEAEVEGGTGDLLGGVGVAPCPGAAVGGVEHHPNRVDRRPPAAQPVRVGSGGHAQVGDVAEPGGRGAVDAEGVGHVLAVGPRLHQPGGDRARRAHVGAVPRQPGPRIGIDERLDQRQPGTGEPGEDVVGRKVTGVGGDLVRHVGAPSHHHSRSGAEALGVDQRLHGGVVEVRQVRDLVADPPARSRRRELPVVDGERLQHAEQVVGLVPEVGDERWQVDGHAAQRSFRHPPARLWATIWAKRSDSPSSSISSPS
jgi:hypothetical protein